MYLDKIVTISRLTPLPSDPDKEQYQTVSGYEAVSMNIQPAGAELTAVADGVYGQTYSAFCNPLDIQIGDRVTVSGMGLKMIVKGVNDYNWGPIPHLEVVLFLTDN